MTRPQCCRQIVGKPPCTVFKPRGVPVRFLEEVVLTLDEFEALRLADLEGLYHEQAAASMNVSRQTFGRIVDSARRKTAEALILGKALRIEGGNVELTETRRFKCQDCQHAWDLPHGGGRPAECPNCKSTDFCRADGDCRGSGGPGGPEGQGGRRCRHRHGQTR